MYSCHFLYRDLSAILKRYFSKVQSIKLFAFVCALSEAVCVWVHFLKLFAFECTFWSCLRLCVHFIKLFAFECISWSCLRLKCRGKIGSRSVFTFAAVRICMRFLLNALFKRENCLASDISRQLKRRQLYLLCRAPPTKLHACDKQTPCSDVARMHSPAQNLD